MKTRRPREVTKLDIHIGARIRMRRLEKSISQEKLGDALGVSFQQVQKYERGTNRVASGRLSRIAEMLEVEIGFFYQDAPDKTNPGCNPEASILDRFITSREGVVIARAFERIASPAMRTAVVRLVRAIAAGRDDELLEAAE
jgi:transcriptional regulator with XRE-family HTH domain